MCYVKMRPKKNTYKHRLLLICRFALLLFFCFSSVHSFAGAKIDTVYFQKGDRITGEVKSMANDLLKLSTDDSGSLDIEWDKIDSIHIKSPVWVTLMNGESKYGTIQPTGKKGECFLIHSNAEHERISLLQIVKIIPLKKRFIDRLSGTVSSGFSYAKASDVAKLDFNGNLQYNGEKIIFQIDYNVVLTQESTGTTQRQSGGASLYRVLPDNWSIKGRVFAESNSYFLLDLRTTVALGPNYFFIRSNKQQLSGGTGLLANKEFSGNLTQNNLEGLLQVSYRLFIFDTPEISINVSSNLIPSLSDFGRIRNETDANIRWEVFNDFYLKLTFYNSYDNKPLSGVNVRNDWGTTLGLEYKF